MAPEEYPCPCLQAHPVLPPEFIPREMAGVPVEKQLLALMRAHQQLFETLDRHVNGLIGGELKLRSVTPDGMAEKTLAKFEDYETIRHAAAAVQDRILRGDDVMFSADGLVRYDPIDAEPSAAPRLRP
jgi:hypothetical protein